MVNFWDIVQRLRRRLRAHPARPTARPDRRRPRERVGHVARLHARRHPSTSSWTATPANASTTPSPTTRPWTRTPARTSPTASPASSPCGPKRPRRAGSELLGPGPGATEPTMDHRRRRHPTRDQRMVRSRHHARTTHRHGSAHRLHPDRLNRSRLSRNRIVHRHAAAADATAVPRGPVNHFHRRHQPPNQ